MALEIHRINVYTNIESSLGQGDNNMISPCVLATKPDNSIQPSRFISRLFVLLLLFIHTLDMWLTRYWIGDDWDSETFLPMSYCIKWFGIYNAVWISRISIYTMLFLYFLNWRKRGWKYFLITGTILYWVSMISWLRTLGYTDWP